MKLGRSLTAAVAALVISSCQVADSSKPVPHIAKPKAARVYYGADPGQYADVFSPHQKLRGVIVFVHGGAWMSGGTSWEEVPSWIRAQQSSGWAVVSVSYRMGGSHVLDGMVRDVVSAVSYVKKSRTYNTLPVYIAGHSAGATLAMRAALYNTDLSGLILAAAPLEMRQLATSDASVFGYRLSYIVNNALGCPGVFNGPNTCDASVLDRYDLTTEQISTLPPTYIAAGGRDQVVLPEWSKSWYEELVSVKGDNLVWFDFVENAEHSLDGANHEALSAFLSIFSKK